ncbi:TetR/AcrR family transcriptional regulator [Paenibacillus sp. GCM10012307]|uniref:TetR/AcrR family transcriptional regulator n=1 Tax=Paenibacillus roseus TaxID=2798579 RepID=A0A934J372_9BACL|nr:TetR/AcrR family transcriptional regulator [Paenibacillus roseus]MBJ6362444.1 TetR/AcrR family transcriptional regulator [Paenibacillus roseus]
MSRQSREKMIEGAVKLLALRGLHAASFSEIIEATGAPRGSIYHHFPGGKDQLIAEAINLAGSKAVAFIHTLEGQPAEVVGAQFIEMWRTLLTTAKFQAGCSVLAVTVAAGSQDLLNRAAAVFRQWSDRLTELLAADGLGKEDAQRLAAILISSCEGAVAISRAQQTMDTFELVAEQLLLDIRRAKSQS